MRIPGSDIYPAGTASTYVKGSTPAVEPSAVVNSGDSMDDEKANKNPIIAIVALIGLLVGIRFLWELAGE